MSSYFPSFLSNHKILLSLTCIAIILNSVVTSKILKVKTSKFDPKAYVAMTIVVTAAALISLLITPRFDDFQKKNKIIIANVLLGLTLAYYIHSIHVLKKLRELNERSNFSVCILNLMFLGSILITSLVMFWYEIGVFFKSH